MKCLVLYTFSGYFVYPCNLFLFKIRDERQKRIDHTILFLIVFVY